MREETRSGVLRRVSALPGREIGAMGVVVALAWLLLGPRLAIASIGGSSLRLEDLIFVGLLAYTIVNVVRFGTRLTRIARGVTIPLGALLAVSMSSAIASSASGGTSLLPAVLYAVRPIEYAVAGAATAVAMHAASSRTLRLIGRLLVLATILNTAFAILQIVLKVPIGFSKVSYDRGAGLTGGPYELGAIAAMLIVLWCIQRRWVLASIAGIGLLLSASRISLIGCILGLVLVGGSAVIRGARRRRTQRAEGVSSRWSTRRIVTTAAALVVLAAALPIAYGVLARPLVERLGDTSVSGSWAFSGAIADREPLVNTSQQYASIAYGPIIQQLGTRAEASGVEASNGIRFYRWHLVLDNVNEPREYLLGLGPSFIGPSLDGSYLRFYAETGILGVLAWLALIVGWFRTPARGFGGMFLSLLVTAVFIDIFWSMRPMTLFWMLFAVAMSRRSILELGRSSSTRLPGARRPRHRSILGET